jgi:hypothetical protein
VNVLPAVLLAALAFFAGRAPLRLLGVGKGLLGLAVAPSIGLAVLIVVSAWTDLAGAPPVASTLLVLAIAGAGALVTVRQLPTVRRLRLGDGADRLFWSAVGLTALLPVLIVGIAIGQIQAPLSPHDGAFHVEIMHALRSGQPWSNWYPPGLHALFVAVLLMMPWLDTARGAYELALGLAVLAPTAVFGLGLALWRRSPLAAAAAGALVALTFIFPYGLHIWGGWPLAAAILIVVGLWTVALTYLEDPSWRWAAIAGLLGGAIALEHGTELYTATIGLVVFGVAAWPRVPFKRLPRDASLALLVAVVVAVPYVPILMSWASVGGATGVGMSQAAAVESSVERSGAFYQVQGVLIQVFDVNPLARLLLLPLGVWWALRTREARSLIVLVALYVCLIGAFTFIQSPPVQAFYAAVFPWAQEYRLLYIAIIGLRLLEGGGVCALVHLTSRAWQRRQTWRAAHPIAARRVLRTCLVLGGSVVVLSFVGVTVLLASAARPVDAYSVDDAAAMAWLRANVQPGELVANDLFADAGIWAPEKAGVAILWPRVLPALPEPDQRMLVLHNIGHLEDVPEAAAAACQLNVRYVYSGAAGTAWEERHFPPLAGLRQSSALEDVFSSGDAVIFRTNLNCGP